MYFPETELATYITGFWKLQLDSKKSGTILLRSPDISRELAFRTNFPEKEITAYGMSFWMVKLDKESGSTRLETLAYVLKQAAWRRNSLHVIGEKPVKGCPSALFIFRRDDGI